MKVTVIIPAYNAASVIGSTIQSVLSQTISDWEIIVVDDASTDVTSKIAAEFNVTIIRHTVNSGVSVARNTGITAAGGTYFAFLDADDAWEPRFLEVAVATLERTKSDFFFANGIYVDSSGRNLGPFQVRSPIRPTQGTKALSKMIRANYIKPAQVVVTRSAVAKLGPLPFDSSSSPAEDWDFWLMLLMAGAQIVYSNEQLVRYLIHQDTYYSGSQMGDAQRRVIKKHYHGVIAKHDLRRQFLNTLTVLEMKRALLLFRSGRRAEATNLLRWAMSRNPLGVYWVIVRPPLWRVARAALMLVRSWRRRFN